MLALALTLVLLAPGEPAGAAGKVFLTPEEALALAFPDCRIERVTEYLSEVEEERAVELAREKLASRIVRPYRAYRAGQLIGTAYFDAHRVRTKSEVLMLVVGPDQRLGRVEVLAFAEPLEYLPKANFYAQFPGRGLDAELDLKRAIRGVSGATLSAQSATAAARRTLALHRVLAERATVPVAVAGR